MSGGVGANVNYDRQVNPKSTPQTPEERKASMKKHLETKRKAMELVRQDIIKKYGKDALL